MAQAGHNTSFWRSVRQLPDRTPLRTKLISAVLALVVIALALISFVGISSLETYLIDRADNQVQALYVQYSGQTPGFGPGHQFGLGPSVGANTIVEAVSSTGQTYPAAPFQSVSNGPKVPLNASWLADNELKPVTVPAQTGGNRWRVIVGPRQIVRLSNGSQIRANLVYGLDVTDIYAAIGRLALIDLLVSVLIVLLLAAVATAAVRASLRPLKEIEETAGAIAAGDLTQRVPERDPRTEVGRLGRSLNIMLGQIETAFRQRSESAREARRSEERMRQFVADASHELRTPLTAIRGFAEYYRQRGGVAAGGSAAPKEPDQPGAPAVAEHAGGGTGPRPHAAPNGNRHLAHSDLDRIMRRVEQESARMGILVEDMLLLARLDQQRPLDYRPLDLLTLAADAVHDARVVAPNRNINLTVASDAAPILLGDEVRLRQVIGNLMSNALTHTPDGTPIEVRLRSGTLAAPQRPGGYTAVGADPQHAVRVPAAVLEVTDSGPGLTPEQAEHAFERFYRADQARSTGGTGLGLAIVAALVAAHGGTVWVDSEPGHGATFGIALPLAPEAVAEAEDADATSDMAFTDELDPAEAPGPAVPPRGASAGPPAEPGRPTTQPPAP